MSEPDFVVRLADGADERDAAARLRYDVFVRELGGDGPSVDHSLGLERDEFDRHCKHLLLIDRSGAAASNDQVVGVYRLLPQEEAERLGRFYCDAEYDLTELRRSGRRLLELGRSCLRPDYRGGAAMFHLWQGLADYVTRTEVEILFGVASFHGTDPAALAEPLSLLHHDHLAPEGLRPRSRVFQPMDLVPPERIDRRRAMLQVPALIKAYLRLGGHVGEGAFVDHAFNTTDVCLVLDTHRMNARNRDIYARTARS